MYGPKDSRAIDRERERRREQIMEAAWQVAGACGWAAFSLERVALRADLGRASVQSTIGALEDLIVELAERALFELSSRLAAAETLEHALDVPARFAREQRAAFSLLFPTSDDARPAFSCARLNALRAHARNKLGRLERLARRAGHALPKDEQSSAAFLTAISLGAAAIPALRDSTTLRHRWQEFCLSAR